MKVSQQAAVKAYGRYPYGLYIFRIAPHFVLRECKRLYVKSESMQSERTRLQISKKSK